MPAVHDMLMYLDEGTISVRSFAYMLASDRQHVELRHMKCLKPGQQTDFLHLKLLLEVDGTIHLHFNALLN
jgi:hypothetical protein